MSKTVAFIKLRNAIYAEDGYCLDVSHACPEGLKSDIAAHFLVLDLKTGKPLRMMPVPGCSTSADDTRYIHLQRYGQPDTARTHLERMCEALPDAMQGNADAIEKLGVAWLGITAYGCDYVRLPHPERVEILRNLYGAGVVHDELQRKGTLAHLGKLDIKKAVREALGL